MIALSTSLMYVAALAACNASVGYDGFGTTGRNGSTIEISDRSH